MERVFRLQGILLLFVLLVTGGCALKDAAPPEGAPAPAAPPVADSHGGGAPLASGIPEAVGAGSPEQAIEALVTARNARDVAAILALFAPGANVMTWLPDQGRDAMVPLDMYSQLLPPKVQGWVQANRRHAMERLEAPTVQGNSAQVRGVLRITEGQGDSLGMVRGMFVWRLQRIDGRWRIVEERYEQAG